MGGGEGGGGRRKGEEEAGRLLNILVFIFKILISRPGETEEQLDKQAIYVAVTMNAEERKSRHTYAWNYVCRHTSERWAETFVDTLRDAIAERRDLSAKARRFWGLS